MASNGDPAQICPGGIGYTTERSPECCLGKHEWVCILLLFFLLLLLVAYTLHYSPPPNRLTVLAHDSTWVTRFLLHVFEYVIHRSGVLTALTWLVLNETAAVSMRSVYTIQPCTMSLHAKRHTKGACVFSSNLPPARLAEWPGSFTCYCGNTGVERIPK